MRKASSSSSSFFRPIAAENSQPVRFRLRSATAVRRFWRLVTRRERVPLRSAKSSHIRGLKNLGVYLKPPLASLTLVS
jgi:hypothetical protein